MVWELLKKPFLNPLRITVLTCSAAQVQEPLLEQHVPGWAAEVAEHGGGVPARRALVVEAYELCVALNLANPMSYQAYAQALAGTFGDTQAAAAVLQRMLAAVAPHPRHRMHEETAGHIQQLQSAGQQ